MADRSPNFYREIIDAARAKGAAISVETNIFRSPSGDTRQVQINISDDGKTTTRQIDVEDYKSHSGFRVTSIKERRRDGISLILQPFTIGPNPEPIGTGVHQEDTLPGHHFTQGSATPQDRALLNRVLRSPLPHRQVSVPGFTNPR